MKYIAYKMHFPNGVHLGKKTVDDSNITFYADTLFSALCQEAVKNDAGVLQELYEKAKTGDIVFSDAFPYIGDTYYIPKPLLRTKCEAKGDSKAKKAFKKLSYIPLHQLDSYMSGTMDIEQEVRQLGDLGRVVTKVSASVRGEEETIPYRVGICQFNINNGLYFILGYKEEQDKDFVEELLMTLAYSGIGGKRYAGLGRFELYPGKLDEKFCKRFSTEGNYYMTLSVSLPTEQEIEAALDGAFYMLLKRSGFVASHQYAEEYVRKKDIFVFSAGSCVRNCYQGDIYDVSNGGKHLVYRYAKPMFLEVSV
ncbi:MAG: type III-A CRISPR-associated RAMP protein Csm4 [Bacteroides sp.]|nr:type III-A CRISPR-associated RAMP protein Csm4 [Bacteroides sp.]MCM1548738.1 type III-A CRISPR-associated RAMP protein Csm4 [Clostridium sp.]